ncbi:helix-turn-helix transcriptional regulator [Catenuloplanes indicus JCM 9534]
MLDSKGRKVPTLRAQWLGRELRDLRERRNLTLRQVAEHLKRNFSALSRFENAEWPIPRHDVQMLLDLYGVSERRERTRLTRLSEEVWRRDDWIDEFSDVIYDPTFCDLIWLEQRAKRVGSYDALYVLGLLQTPAYAEAMIRTVEGPDADDDRIARWVQLRLRRQRAIEGPKPTRVAAIVAESVLRNPVGGPDVMREQLMHLGRLARRRHIEISVLPAGAGAHPGLDGAFLLFEMPDPFPDVAYTETIAGRTFQEGPRTGRFASAYRTLREAALEPADSTRLIADIADEFKS